MGPPKPFRRVYRSFAAVDFDPVKSDEVLAERGFDLAYIARVFPGFVLEREDTRDYNERRYQVVAELDDLVFCLVYMCRGAVCRLITAWEADEFDIAAWYSFGPSAARPYRHAEPAAGPGRSVAHGQDEPQCKRSVSGH
jgi:uncharacterized DUF497 family protein